MSDIQFDFNSIKQRITDRLRAKESWADILYYSANSRLIDIFAEELAYVSLYDEILTTETKWSLAQQRSSLMAETQFFNYYPFRKQGAKGSIRLSTSETFDSSFPLSISIPKFSTFTTNSSMNFVATETLQLTAQDNYINVPIVQGIAKEFTYTALGELYETFNISNDSIENTVIEIYINNQVCSLVDNIREAEKGTSLVCELRNLNDFSGIQLKFGNGSFGYKLNTNDIVTVRYVETLGLFGNIESSNMIINVDSVFEDENGEEVDLYCNNLEPITGGTQYEDIESIRLKAPKSYQLGDRAVSKDDYKYILESFNFTKKATCWGETEVNEDEGNIPGTFISLEENVVHLSAVNTSDQTLTTAQMQLVREELDSKKSPTDIIVFEPVDFIYINFVTDAYISDRKYSLSLTKNNIINSLTDAYSINNSDFMTRIRYSDYVSLIDRVQGVDYHDTEVYLSKYYTFNSEYEADISTIISDIQPSTVKVYIKDSTTISNYSLIGSDDGSGSFTAEASYDLTGSSINYSTGEGNLLVTAGLSAPFSSYSIRLDFSLDDRSIILQKRNQIASYGTSLINVSYT